ncbi:hypothetical protein Tco_1098316, partial [Tanacetum coccineum]
HPSRTFSRCSVMYCGTPVMSAGFRENMTRLRLSYVSGPETIVHSSGIILLLYNVSIPPGSGNFNIPWAVDETALILLTPGRLMIPLYEDGDLTTTKFIHAEVECYASPIFTSSDICPTGYMISPLKPIRGAWLPNSASMIMGPSVLSSSPRGGNEISKLGEKPCVILCLATLCQGWTIKIAKALSFLDVSPLFAAFGWSFPLPCFSSLITCDNFPALSK